MRVKRFTGENVAETVGKVKKDLGPEAIILQTRQYREGGFLGFFGKIKVEIMAAIEERSRPLPGPVPEAYTAESRRVPTPAESRRAPTPAESRRAPTPAESQSAPAPAAAQHTPAPAARPERAPEDPGVGNAHTDVSAVLTELRQTQTLVSDMSRQMESLRQMSSIWPQALQGWAEGLRRRGIGEALTMRLLRRVQGQLPEEQWSDRSLVWSAIRENVSRLCNPTARIVPGMRAPLVVALVGPTGVGKTTTIGKLAAGFSLVDKRRVALVTVDTYRVAAVEQLKTFAGIIGVPMDVAMTPTELRGTLNRYADKEIIFIDTAGRSPLHDAHMSELRAFLEQAKPDLTLLVLSATTQTVDQLQVFQRFKSFATHLVLTKLDETSRAGSLLNILEQTTLPTAYLTTGQNVPDDIEAADAGRLADYVLGEEDMYA
ncbi:Signal recognition particle, SRP54 subunit, GTPase domain protein [Acididesulfobacillus acetoxydans]|uniref:Flagellar biosynthesis protein FlhF n=1 Tax=Acididesulfobacillus acetoxydans TaxID=1561005 RepID=A0A8S0WHW0_9FIRM|nr:flagellar biosynthesis protein FlhF [Acididesulfobacillus acetoxydans]CAA7602952.1 Signal recognition particle, SRP54 subunit, GTPase domain protein [Acididesulfobacillus acetoxydans]CEJ05834.1 Flagellar biosynthesis protein FlhF [Acididesulfobacillus acetoxydans]